MNARFLIALPLLLAACVEGFPIDPSAPRMDQAGTCFATVSAEKDGTFTMLTGIGDGTPTPMAVKKAGLSAEAVDAAFAHEVQIMQINPECLAIYTKGRDKTLPPKPADAPKP